MIHYKRLTVFISMFFWFIFACPVALFCSNPSDLILFLRVIYFVFTRTKTHALARPHYGRAFAQSSVCIALVQYPMVLCTRRHTDDLRQHRPHSYKCINIPKLTLKLYLEIFTYRICVEL